MKNNKFNQWMSKGQVLPLIVLLMFVIIGMIALILDGGAILSFRRTAQAAADAGALAGAQRICRGYSDWKPVAESYAINNGASSAVATLNGNEVTVVAVDASPSFFARIFGQDTLQASADATAGCFYPSVAKRVLPIAFFYAGAPVNAEKAICNDDGLCNLVNWDFEELMTNLDTIPIVDVSTKVVNHPFDDIYVISDSIKVCEKESGTIYCKDMKLNSGGGARTFIDLTAIKAPPANLSNIIQDGVDEPLYTPSWVNVESAVNADVYNDKNYDGFDKIVGYEDLNARLFFVPVFDLFCEKDPKTNCSTDPDDIFDYLVNINQASYRLIGFAPFVVTGVTKNNICTFGEEIPYGVDGTWTLGAETITFKKNEEPCPGYAALKAQLEKVGETISKDALEGYFVDDFPADQYLWGTEGVDVGVYLIDLSD